MAIARALINDPKLMLADEPTGNLDTKTSEEVMAVFQRLNDGGKTVVLITHEQDIAEYARRIVVLPATAGSWRTVRGKQRRATSAERTGTTA